LKFVPRNPTVLKNSKSGSKKGDRFDDRSVTLSDGREKSLDFTVGSATAIDVPNATTQIGAAAIEGEAKKFLNLSKDFYVSNVAMHFVPLAFETTGLIGPCAIDLINDMASTTVDLQAPLLPPDERGVHKVIYLSGQRKAIRVQRFTERLSAVCLRGSGVAFTLLLAELYAAARTASYKPPDRSPQLLEP
jgi:hypothetical protein